MLLPFPLFCYFTMEAAVFCKMLFVSLIFDLKHAVLKCLLLLTLVSELDWGRCPMYLSEYYQRNFHSYVEFPGTITMIFFAPYNTPLKWNVCIFLIFLEWPSLGLFVKMASSPVYFLLLPLWLWYVQFCFRRLSSFVNLLVNIHIIKHIVGLLIGIHLKVSSL